MAKPYFTCEAYFTNPARIYFVEKSTLTGAFFMAEDEGFEPPQTESESGVLPLHKSSVYQHGYYTHFFGNVK